MSAVLAVGMITSVLPIPAFAETGNSQRTLLSTLEQENDAADDIIEIELNSGQPRWPDKLDASACEWVAIKYQTPKFNLKNGKFKLIEDGLGTDVALTIEENAELLDGTINGSVDNRGIIWEGKFEPAYNKETKSVGNSGTINGGTFKDPVGNGASGSSPSPSLGYISGGTFLGQVKNYGTITGDAEIRFDAKNTKNNSGKVYNYNVISGGRFSNCTIITNSSNEDIFETGSSRLTFRGISGGVFENCTIQKYDELNWIKGGTFVDCDITGQVITGGIYNKDPGAQREAVVQFENGTDTFSLVKNGEEEVPGVITGVTKIYAASTVRRGAIPTKPTEQEEIPIDRTFVITPSVPVWNVNGDTTKHCAAGGMLELSTADAQDGKILLNVKKDFTLTVNGRSEQKAYNEDVEVTAEDKTGETFTGWTVEGVEVADKSSKKLNFKMPANNVTLTANYSTNSYTLTVNGESEQKAYNEDVEVTAEDKAGETFTGWTVEGVEVADKNSKKLNFKMPANNVTLTANYSTNSYTLTVNGESEQKAYNEDVEVTAEDKTGETFTGWTVEGVEVADKSSKKLNFKMPANNVTLTANYSTNSYTLTVNGESEQKAYNEDVEVTAEDKAGETFTGWTVEGVEVEDKSSKKLNFKMPANNVTLTANYATNSYTLTVRNGSPESVTDEVGTKVTLTANEPDGGMTFDRWELSDDTILVSGELTDQIITVKIPEGGATAEATYKNLPVTEDTYNLTTVNCKAYKADNLQTVLPKDAKLEEGTPVVVTFTDTPEDVFDKWIIESNIELEPLEETNEEGVHSIKIMMPACEVVITATTNPVVPEQPDNPSGGGGAGGAVAVVGGVVIAGVAIGAGIVVANHYITTNLPQGFDLPTTRQQLAVVLWNMAGKPEVTPAENYTDVEDVEAKKAVHWVVEKQLMEPESENVFGAQKSVSKLKTLQLMIKTNNLMRAEVQ